MGIRTVYSSDHYVRLNEHTLGSAFIEQIWPWSPLSPESLLHIQQHIINPNRLGEKSSSEALKLSWTLNIAHLLLKVPSPPTKTWLNLIIYSLGFSKYVNICKVECLPML